MHREHASGQKTANLAFREEVLQTQKLTKRQNKIFLNPDRGKRRPVILPWFMEIRRKKGRQRRR